MLLISQALHAPTETVWILKDPKTLRVLKIVIGDYDAALESANV